MRKAREVGNKMENKRREERRESGKDNHKKGAHSLEIMSKQLTTLVSFIIAAKRTHDEKQLRKQRENYAWLSREVWTGGGGLVPGTWMTSTRAC